MIMAKDKLQFPQNLLRPVSNFLTSQLSTLQRNKKKISTEDPFNNKARDLDNAAMDSEAEEQYGHARVSAIKKALSLKIVQVKKALTRVKIGKYGICEDCGNMINTDRLAVFPEATFCVRCEKKREK